ncbi:hypothetical protein [Amycolatopsis sp. NPDC059657]|uniref:hypothetical protein n=1 Tax=Amycolatopsis sp. NPDC059657 TaxID=3346899 RepID=UPI00366EBB3B
MEERGLNTQDLLDAGHAHESREVEPDNYESERGEVSERDEVSGNGEVSEVGEVSERGEVEAGSDENAPINETRQDEPARELFGQEEVEGFRAQWQELQAAFVDDPRRAVEDADQLVAAIMQSLAATFAEHKRELESQWQQGEAPTEDLRVALRSYRSFFNQLLSA